MLFCTFKMLWTEESSVEHRNNGENFWSFWVRMEECSPQQLLSITELKTKAQCVYLVPITINMAACGKNTCIFI